MQFQKGNTNNNRFLFECMFFEYICLDLNLNLITLGNVLMKFY